MMDDGKEDRMKIKDMLKDMPKPPTPRFGKPSGKQIVKWIIAAVLVVAIVALAAFLLSLFRVKEIRVEGSRSFSSEKIVELSEAKIGDSLVYVGARSTAKKISDGLRYVESVKIKKNIFTGVLTLRIQERDILYFVKYGKRYYMTDSQLTVLGSSENPTELTVCGGKYLTLPEFVVDKVGKPLIFLAPLDGTEEENQRRTLKAGETAYLFTFLEQISQTSYFSRMNAVLAGNRFECGFVYDGIVKVSLGSMNGLESKFALLDVTVKKREEEGNAPEVPTMIDVSGKDAIVMEDEKADMSIYTFR